MTSMCCRIKMLSATVRWPLRIYTPGLLCSPETCGSNASDTPRRSRSDAYLTVRQAIQRTILLSVLCGIFVGSANAKIYVHKDTAGVLHFSNVPPSGYQPSVQEGSNGIAGHSLA